jgi:AcrR family transcriptional regulator
VPARVDYVARYQFLRQAAFALVRDDAVEALTRRRLAAELGCGVNTVRRLVDSRVDLVRLAADEVVTRRRCGRLNRRSEDLRELVANVVRALMPEDETHVDEELVWLRLVAACSLRSTGSEPPGQTRREFLIAQRGYDDGLPVEPPPTQEASPGHEDRRSAMQPYLHAHQEEMASMVDRVLELIGVPEPREDTASVVTAIIEGLTLAVCLGRIDPVHATQLAIDHVMSLGGGGADAA